MADTVNPIPGFTLGRQDAGVDASAPVGTPIVAPAGSRLVQVLQNWYQGQPLLLFQWLQKPIGALSNYWYVAEQVTPTTEQIGTTFQQGQEVGTFAPSGTGIEIGYGSATSSSRTLAGESGAGDSPGPWSQGFLNLIKGSPNSGVPAAVGGAQTTTTGAIVQQAASQYGVPANLLWGVYGMETGYGSDVTTSSAGAMGSFQFIQSTAAAYNYPYTNSTDEATFQAQATAAAHYLSDLFKQKGTWDAALRAYSGGGYGLAQVQAKGRSFASSAGSKLPYGGTRPGGQTAGSGSSSGSSSSDVSTVFQNYLSLRDMPRTAPPGTKNPIQWFLASFTGNWNNLGVSNLGTYNDPTALPTPTTPASPWPQPTPQPQQGTTMPYLAV